MSQWRRAMSSKKQPVELAICMGSSCFSRGNKNNIKVIKAYIARHGVCDKVVLKGHLCEGLCKEGPNITIEGEVFHAVDGTTLPALLDQHLKKQD